MEGGNVARKRQRETRRGDPTRKTVCGFERISGDCPAFNARIRLSTSASAHPFLRGGASSPATSGEENWGLRLCGLIPGYDGVRSCADASGRSASEARPGKSTEILQWYFGWSLSLHRSPREKTGTYLYRRDKQRQTCGWVQLVGGCRRVYPGERHARVAALGPA